MSEYYKYHNEVPRMFFLPLSDLMAKYFDKVRSINYKKIKKIIQKEQKEPMLNEYENDTVHSRTYNQMSKSIQVLNTFLKDMSVHRTMNHSITIQDIQKCLIDDKENQNDNYQKLEQIDSNFDFESRLIEKYQNQNENQSVSSKLMQTNQIRLQKQKLQKLAINR